MVASNTKAQDVLKRLLPRAFYKFIQTQNTSTSPAEVFCSQNFLTLNCIWTRSMREYLQAQLRPYANQLEQALVMVKREDCERQIIDVKRFVLDNQSFIPMMWFETL